jgi:hypothetical protein
VSFFASTLARNFLQALSITIVTLVGGYMSVSLLGYFWNPQFSILGILPWPSLPPILIGAPTLLVTLIWLVYGNFNWFHEGWRLWRRNALGVLAAVLFVFVSSALLYNRAWEVFQPAEPAHGPAKFSLANRPVLQGDFYNGVRVRLPDGRVWFDSLSYSFLSNKSASPGKRWWRLVADPRPASAGPQQFLAGSNWVSAMAVRVVDPTWSSQMLGGSGLAFGYLYTVGIQANGTLWISSHVVPNVWSGQEMTQFGYETNWQQIIRQNGCTFLLLKDNGTLWRWGTNHLDWDQWRTWPTVRNNPPRQIGTNSDWKEIFDDRFPNARKTDGSSWRVSLDFKTGLDKVERMTNFYSFPFANSASTLANGRDGDESAVAYVGTNGSLWARYDHDQTDENGRKYDSTGVLQVGHDTNWVAVAITWPALVALKADGSLWKWKPVKNNREDFSQTPPTRLGIHHDWMGLTEVGGGAVTLAADGSLWLWTETSFFGDRQPWIRLPKQPKFLGNVFSEAKSKRMEESRSETLRPEEFNAKT